MDVQGPWSSMAQWKVALAWGVLTGPPMAVAVCPSAPVETSVSVFSAMHALLAEPFPTESHNAGFATSF